MADSSVIRYIYEGAPDNIVWYRAHLIRMHDGLFGYD